MTARTWLGGRAFNQVSNLNNWSPRGAPEPGDTLTATHGTLNIFGDQLPDTATLNLTNADANLIFATGDHITASGTVRVNMLNSDLSLTNAPGSPNNNITVNAAGSNHLNVGGEGRFSFGQITVNNYGILTGSISGFATSNFTLNGGLFANTASSGGYDGKHVTINADVIGTGSFAVGSFHAPFAVRGLEFMKSVGPGQTVTMQSLGVLDIDHPETFDAKIEVENNLYAVNLHDLVADSYTYDALRDDLTFFSGDTVVKSLRFDNTNQFGEQPFFVSQGTTDGGVGIEIRSPAQILSPPFGADLPQHVSLLAA